MRYLAISIAIALSSSFVYVYYLIDKWIDNHFLDPEFVLLLRSLRKNN